jgi:hypothetical protein
MAGEEDDEYMEVDSPIRGSSLDVSMSGEVYTETMLAPLVLGQKIPPTH